MARNSLLCADVPLRNYSLTLTFDILVLLLITYIRFYFHNNLDGTK